GKCDPPCDNNHVCILSENTCSQCGKYTCRPKENPKCVTCLKATCPSCASNCECWIQKRFCYSCETIHCVKSPK
ncbi:28513_t:CDS:2, partial [Racocetra persica]